MTFRGDVGLQVFILSTCPLHSVGIYACILCFRTSLKWRIHVSAQTNATAINLPKALQIPYRRLLAVISSCPVVSKNLVMNQHLDGCREFSEFRWPGSCPQRYPSSWTSICLKTSSTIPLHKRVGNRRSPPALLTLEWGRDGRGMEVHWRDCLTGPGILINKIQFIGISNVFELLEESTEWKDQDLKERWLKPKLQKQKQLRCLCPRSPLFSPIYSLITQAPLLLSYPSFL